MATARLARAGAAPTQRKSESRSRMAWKCTRCSPSCPLKSCRAMPPAAPPPPAASIAASPGAARPEHARPEREAGPGSGEAVFAPPRREAPPRYRPCAAPAPSGCLGRHASRSPRECPDMHTVPAPRSVPAPPEPPLRPCPDPASTNPRARVQPPGSASPPCPLPPEPALSPVSAQPLRFPLFLSHPKRHRHLSGVWEHTRRPGGHPVRALLPRIHGCQGLAAAQGSHLPGLCSAARPGEEKAEEPQGWGSPTRWQGNPCVQTRAWTAVAPGRQPRGAPGLQAKGKGMAWCSAASGRGRKVTATLASLCCGGFQHWGTTKRLIRVCIALENMEP